MAEFEQIFGGQPKLLFLPGSEEGGADWQLVAHSHFLLYYSMRLFFYNGGGPCWIVSVGDYGSADAPVIKSARHFEAAWPALSRQVEPTIVVVPDAVLLPLDDHAAVSNAALQHCADLRDRIAILDVYNGDRRRTRDAEDVISGSNGFRQQIRSEQPSFGAAYYPWLKTSVVGLDELNYTNLTADGRARLLDMIKAASIAEPGNRESAPQMIFDLVSNLKDEKALSLAQTHQALLQASRVYQKVVTDMLEIVNVMPPSAAMAGILASIDNTQGVFCAPANTGIVSASPVVPISDADQEDLNTPLDGKSVNAIRTFFGRGVLVWGARTLDGNSQDWRYINVRRTMIMLEQSIRLATEAYAFQSNDAGTWRSVKTMIENFLSGQWKRGALAGATPADAFQVSVGLDPDMTATDSSGGFMQVTVKLAIVRPAEFIILSFQQKMLTS
ncbi:phage tail sheath family protein [Hoeflea ulvae]|uniref:Phage tail sheath subtilisin-like domain-containing protein n=1 Tax=Hoeflea ulvae TaxID=2983764 RepID=A0ABT3YGE2_9HYPH|nr:phage tail sheath C-terminal domain-containing protein [Hoeflea ulvae]MCY0094974.1 phage tail sheath subtilisin-like domain-containing protein [Hoeflea ulvae]